jgi:hypothetical protein
MTDRELLQMALDALEKGAWDTLRGRNAAEALRARLAQPEPVLVSPKEFIAAVTGKWDISGIPALMCVWPTLEEAQPEPEPVAWMTNHDEPLLFPTKNEASQYCNEDEEPQPLYTAPPQEPQIKQRTGDCLLTGVCAAEGHSIQKPQREWQGLTNEDVWELVQKTPDFSETVAAIEAKLRAKNTNT